MHLTTFALATLLTATSLAADSGKFDYRGVRQEVLVAKKDDDGAANCRTIAEWTEIAFKARSESFRRDAALGIGHLARNSKRSDIKLTATEIEECRKAGSRFIGTQDVAIRLEGVRILGFVGEPGDVLAIDALAKSTSDRDLVLSCVESLKLIGGPVASRSLDGMSRRVRGDQRLLDAILEAMDHIDIKKGGK